MYKRPLSLLTLALVVCTTNMAALCCREETDLPPANFDTLAQQQGYWEWQSSATEGPLVSPATVGYTRQLVFGTNGQLSIRHNSQPFSEVPYQVSTGTLPRCGAPQQPVPLVTFKAELANNDRKAYSLSTDATGTHLMLSGEDACVDGGYTETYLWKAE
ncbi:hypothetical protein [Hymenobacter yonginensis]|uniref:Lipocalin-like domain-containing protein n=1 Tax=Hymenobacter yonginensis TaxID=748197 RepID=A0ABY7PP43_9BACT|nr:hypothetical protein [Hymenobacter yonginensis]WBO85038.1 hypothetical protein O9Z63_02075 [Hymenobacter yonginensis]